MTEASRNGQKPKFSPFRFSSKTNIKDAPIFDDIDSGKKSRRIVQLVNSLKREDDEHLFTEKVSAVVNKSTASPFGKMAAGLIKKNTGVFSRLSSDPYKAVDPFEIMTAEPEEDEPAEKEAGDKDTGDKKAGDERPGEEKPNIEKSGVEKAGDEKPAKTELTAEVEDVEKDGGTEKKTTPAADADECKEVTREEDILEINADIDNNTFKDMDDNNEEKQKEEKSSEKRHKKRKKSEKSEKGEKKKKRRKERNKSEEVDNDKRRKKRRHRSRNRSKSRSTGSFKRRRSNASRDRSQARDRGSNRRDSLDRPRRSRSPLRRATSPKPCGISVSPKQRNKNQSSPCRKSLTDTSPRSRYPKERSLSARRESSSIEKYSRGKSQSEKSPRPKSSREKSPRSHSPRTKSPNAKTPRSRTPRNKSPKEKSSRSNLPSANFPNEKEISPKNNSLRRKSPKARSPRLKSPGAKSPKQSSKGSKSKSPDSPKEKQSNYKSPKPKRKSRDERVPKESTLESTVETKKRDNFEVGMKSSSSEQTEVTKNDREIKGSDMSTSPSISQSSGTDSKPQLKSYVQIAPKDPPPRLVPYDDDVISISPRDSGDGLNVKPEIPKAEEAQKAHKNKESKRKGNNEIESEATKKLKKKAKKEKRKKKSLGKSQAKDDELDDLLFTKTNKEMELFNDSDAFSAKHNLRTAVVDHDTKKLRTVAKPGTKEFAGNRSSSKEHDESKRLSPVQEERKVLSPLISKPDDSPDPFERFESVSEISEPNAMFVLKPALTDSPTHEKKHSPKHPTTFEQPIAPDHLLEQSPTIPFLSVDKEPEEQPKDSFSQVEDQPYSPEAQAYSPIEEQPYSPEPQPYSPIEERLYSPKAQPYSPLEERPYSPKAQPYSPVEERPYSPNAQPYLPVEEEPYSPEAQAYSPVEDRYVSAEQPVSDFGSPKKSSTMNLSDISTKDTAVENTLGVITTAEKIEDFLGRIQPPVVDMEISSPANGLNSDNDDDIIEQLHKEFVREQHKDDISPGLFLDNNASDIPKISSPLPTAASDPIVLAYGYSGKISKSKHSKHLKKKSKSSKEGKPFATEKKDIEDALNRVHRQARVEDEMKHALKVYFKRKDITKDEYKSILRRAVPQVANSNHGIDPERIRSLVKKYVAKYKGSRERRAAKHVLPEQQDIPFTFSP